jgi:hypothetical protein
LVLTFDVSDELQVNSDPWADHGGEEQLVKISNMKIATHISVDLSSETSSDVPCTNITGV